MISAWKRLLNKADGPDSPASNYGNGNANGNTTMPPGVHKLDKELQRKFARGVNYNMKVVIKGDNQVGKTSLFLRLKGYGFQEEYQATESLNVTSIDWSYKATDDVVKIDLWEAVDSASRKSVNFVDLKTENETLNGSGNGQAQAQGANETATSHITNGANRHTEIVRSSPTTKVTITSTKLQPTSGTNNEGNNNNHDNLPRFIPESARQSLAELSEHYDVYRGAHAVLLVMDMTKSWTFRYIQSELPKIPKSLPVLVIANHRDQGHHRTVSSEQVMAFIDAQARQPGDGILMYTEASMKNGFGMRLIETFFNIPFLKLQEASLVKQLELNRQDFLATREELSLLVETTHKDYEQYLELQTIKRRQIADAMSPVNKGLVQLNESTRDQIRSTSISSDMIDKKLNNVKSIESDNSTRPSVVDQKLQQSFVNDRMPSIVIGAKCPLPDIKSIKLNTNPINPDPKSSHSMATTNLAGSSGNGQKNPSVSERDDDDSEEEEVRANPLVADYQSDLDSDDQLGG